MKTQISFHVLLTALLLLAACREDEIHPRLDEAFVLKTGESAAIQSTALIVSLDSVKDDSRCPDNVEINCFWEGQVTAVVRVAENGVSLGRFDLTLSGNASGQQDKNKVTVSGYRIRLIQVDPYPTGTDPIPMKDYEARLRVSGI